MKKTFLITITILFALFATTILAEVPVRPEITGTFSENFYVKDTVFSAYTSTATGGGVSDATFSGYTTAGRVTDTTFSDYTSTASGGGASPVHNYTSTTTLLSTTKVIPSDGSVPQITEGFTNFSTPFTPVSPTSVIILRGQVQVSQTTGGAVMSCGVFANGASDAVSVSFVLYDGASNQDGIIPFAYKDTSFSAAPRSYMVRCGMQSAGTVYFNAFSNGTQLYGGAETSYFYIEEKLQ